jgi:hypothetical protein
VRIRRRVRRPPDLTSLFDVLFIVVFVALIYGATAQRAAEEATRPKPRAAEPPAPPAKVAVLQKQALAAISNDLASYTPVVVRVSETGVVTAIEGERVIKLDAPLLEASLDPDLEQSYLPDRAADLRLCKLVALHLKLTDLSKHLVIVAPAVGRARRTIGLNEGLDRDVGRCMTEQHAIASIVEPGAP